MAFTVQGFARKLRGLREQYGNTLSEVAERTGIDTQALQAMEAGTATPAGDEVLILADFFKCEFPWLIEDDATNPDENVTMLLRSEGGRLAASDRHAIAEFLHLCKSQALLEEMSGHRAIWEEFQFTPRGKFFKGHGIDCAKALREHHNLAPNAIIPDIFDWLRKSGLRVFRRALPSSTISGLFVRHPEAGRCVLINYNDDIYRQRFSAAHEAGHALLDADKRYNVSGVNDASSDEYIELRASTFASCFLMPPELLKKFGDADWWRQPDKVAEVAGRLFVSIPALLSALKRDKILDEQAVAMIKAARPRLPHKQEPELMGDYTAPQLERKKALISNGLHTTYVEKVLDAHRQSHISQAKAANMLLVEPGEIADIAALFGTSLHHG
ncbi:helix-turn-helix domain-containing protein [Rhodospira trueperi]|uniref:Zn-dependent peptidase ImmA, M78 family n=1 Tax=Rhodospira trueperi TaxID=69960 RepID=A0A1G7HTR5_9PROT|nr:XRE family transcriptional regulator [Rhodospira trueperi]SDF03459.1 Zn-dependent peptidase ImmA, M78 family [Rhodospira trueperi]